MSAEDQSTFEVNVAKQDFKFHAAHFVAFRGFRERIHGHNYQVSVRLLCSNKIGADGYVIDYGDVKKVTRKICKSLNEHFLCPVLSDAMKISRIEESIKIECEDGAMFVFPEGDCAMLPIAHSTTEELAIYLWGEILRALDVEYLSKRGIHTLEVTVGEAAGQEALFRKNVPKTFEDKIVDIADYVMDYKSSFPSGCRFITDDIGFGKWGKCFEEANSNNKNGNNTEYCQCCEEKLRTKLASIVATANAKTGLESLTVEDMKAALFEKIT